MISYIIRLKYFTARFNLYRSFNSVISYLFLFACQNKKTFCFGILLLADYDRPTSTYYVHDAVTRTYSVTRL